MRVHSMRLVVAVGLALLTVCAVMVYRANRPQTDAEILDALYDEISKKEGIRHKIEHVDGAEPFASNSKTQVPSNVLEPDPFPRLTKTHISTRIENILKDKLDRSTPIPIFTTGFKPIRLISRLKQPDVFADHAALLMELPTYHADWVDCAKIFAGDKAEIDKAVEYKRNSISAADVAKSASNCPAFIAERRYIMKPLTTEEEDFSIAFSIVMHHEVALFERLLRAIYRPQNYYCIHVDKKADAAVRQAVENIVSCFINVFIASSSIDVEWSKFSIVEAELVCMQDLLKMSKRWKYFINLTGQEFPLKTNWDLVKILRAFNGSNNMEGTVERRDDTRVTNKPPPPVAVTLTKGSLHIVATRAFVRYVIYNNDSIAFREWVKDTYIPDETYFTSLNHSPHLGVPGAYLGRPETDTENYVFVARFKNWGDGPFNWPCHGQRVRYICVFGVGDLPLLASRFELFANKFYEDYHPAAVDCLEELHFNRTRDELIGHSSFDTSFYQRLSFVHNHI